MPFPPYVHQAFPSTRYHRTEAPRVVQNPDESDALGAGWADTPAAFDDAPEDATDAATPATAATAKRRR